MRSVLSLILFVALASSAPVPAQVPAVGATRDVGVSCLCPGQPITNHPAGTSCMTVCSAYIADAKSMCRQLGGTNCATSGDAWGKPLPTGSRVSSSVSSSSSTSLAIMNAVSGVMGALGSYFEERAAANAAAQQAQLQAMAEARRLQEEALERERLRQRQLFEQAKASVLDRMLGARPGDLQFKGATAGALQMKGLGELTAAERDAQERALDQWMRSRVAQLQQDLHIDARTGLFNYQATPVGPVPPPGPSVAAGWIAQPAAPPPTTQGAAGDLPGGAGQGDTAYSLDTGRVVAAPPLPTPSTTPLTPGGMIGSDGSAAYSVDAGRYVTPPAATGTAYSVDTGKVVTPPTAPGGAYSVDTGRVVTPPAVPEGPYSVDAGRIVTPPASNANGAYSVDTGRVVSPPTSSDSGAYSTDTGRIVDRPSDSGGAYSTDTGRIVTTPAETGTAYSVDAGRRVTPPASTDGPTAISGTGAGFTPAVTTFDGRYTANIAFIGPPGVVATFPGGPRFTFDVVNGTPQSNYVLGSVGANGRLLDGRSQVMLRIGPSGTIVVPIGGVFTVGGATNMIGSVPCGTGVCWVIVRVARLNP